MPDAGLPQISAPTLDLAATLREQGCLDDAEALYRTLLIEQPAAWQAHAGLGLCARLRGDLAGAANHLAEALAAAPQDGAVRLDFANILREQGRAAEAEPIFRALLADAPELWQAAAGLGLSIRARGDWAGAAEHLAAALAAAPGTRWLRLEYATTLRELQRTDEAEAVCRALLADEPGIWQALACLALCVRLRGDLAGACEHLAAALAAAPHEPSVRLDYANVLREQGRMAEAGPLYRGLLEDQPGLWQARAGLGLGARLHADWAASAEHLAAALAAAPDVTWLRLEYAATLRELRRIDEAEAVYRGLLADQPAAWQGMVGLGLCARLRGDRAAAIGHFTAATNVAPDAEEGWFELAGEHREEGRFDAARRVLGALFERGRAGPLAWLGLGHVERWAGDHAASLAAFRDGYAQHADWPQFVIEIATEEQSLGRPAEAERWLLQAAEIPAVAGAALIQLGNAARAREQPDAAVALFARAAALPAAPVGVHTEMAQTLADLGRLAEALAALDAAETRFGPRPELAHARASLLRRAGFRDEALAAVRLAVAAMPTHLPLWYEWFENERLSGDIAGVDRCFPLAPVITVHDRAMVQQARGLLAEQCWQLDAATAAFRETVALHPTLSGAHEILARLCLLRFDIPAAHEHLRIMRGLRTADQLRRGQSPHLAHTHIGNFFDEFVFDDAVLASLVAAQAMPPAERVVRLLALTRATPEHTPTAIALLLALRESGQFDTASFDTATTPETASAIPAGIVQYWDEAVPPDDVAALMQSWRAHNPQHRYARFDNEAAQAFLRGRCPPEVLRAYRRAREPAMKADLFRLAYLFAEGGCYADADDRCLRPLAELLPSRANFVACQEHFGTLGNNFIATAPLHPAIGLALQLAVQAVNRGDDDMVWLATGPGLLTRAFAQSIATSALLPAAWLQHARILARHELERVVATHCDLTYKHSRRHWLRAAFTQTKQPAPAAPAEA